MYLLCWNHDCRQTYDTKNFKATDRDVKCEKCGGTLISQSGKVQLSMNDYVVKTVDPQKLEESKKRFGS
jgi:ribosomal protein S27E